MAFQQNKVRGFPIALMATPGGMELAQKVDQHLHELMKENGLPAPRTFLRDSTNFRFQNGEGKGVINETIRGVDLYLFADVNNYGVSYTRYGKSYPMSPDEHYCDLKRLLGATRNTVQRVNVVMPLLYEGRQHKIRGRESLDCALMLQELTRMGVHTIVCIDAHNSHVHNAIPLHGFENLHATYQLIKVFLDTVKGQLDIGPETLMICSPDLGGMERARYFAEHFRVHLSGFYKVRDLTRVVDGKNPILEHVYLGQDVMGKDVLVVDDMLASGGSMLEVCRELRRRGANRIYLSVTYALFSSGLAEFDKAYEEGMFQYVFATNATYLPDELKSRKWFKIADVTRFLAKFIFTYNQDGSVTRLLDSTHKINKLLGRSNRDPYDSNPGSRQHRRPPTISLKVKDPNHSDHGTTYYG
ncbi:MAG: ribose-phosphate diphosphokinase [Lentisphaerae bacterium]|nr:MAG: ribose-phosphate diphosphokinase [Lentisphaerota bacterium]